MQFDEAYTRGGQIYMMLMNKNSHATGLDVEGMKKSMAELCEVEDLYLMLFIHHNAADPRAFQRFIYDHKGDLPLPETEEERKKFWATNGPLSTKWRDATRTSDTDA